MVFRRWRCRNGNLCAINANNCGTRVSRQVEAGPDTVEYVRTTAKVEPIVTDLNRNVPSEVHENVFRFVGGYLEYLPGVNLRDPKADV